MGDYVGMFWMFALWNLVRKTLFSLILNLLDGKPNAFCSLVLQFLDTGLMLWCQPFGNEKVRAKYLDVKIFSDIIGALLLIMYEIDSISC